MKKIKTLFLVVLLASGIFSCRREFGFPEWDVDVLAPLVKTTLDFNNLVADSLLQENPDNSLTLVYNNNVYSLTADSLFEIPDTTILKAYGAPLPLTFTPGQVLINQSSNTQYNLNGVQLKKVIIRSGYMQVDIKNEIKEVCRVIYSIPLATKNLQPFNKTIYVPAATTSSPGFFSDTFHLDGYTIDLRGSSGNSYNLLASTIFADIDPNATQNVNVNTGDSVVVENSFLDMIPQYALGYFGQGNYASSDTSGFSMLSRIVDGTLLIDSVNIKLNVINEVGVDARVNIGSLTSINTNTGNSISLSHPVIGSTINITRAFDGGNGNVVPSIYSTALSRYNSNIIPMIENLPNEVGYSIDAEINPLGNVSGSNDFIYYGNGVKVNLDMEIPISFAANRLTLADTVDFNFTEAENVKSATLYLFANNGFPFETSVQLYLLDDNMNIVDSLMPAINTIDEAPVDANNVVIQPKLTKLTIPVDENKIAVLRNTRKVLVKIKINTVNYPQYIKIYSWYNINVQLVGDINYHVSQNE